MSFSPTTSGTDPARMAVASWLVSSLGGVRCSTTLRFLWVALNCLTRYLAGPSVACRAQKCTVPVAFTPKSFEDVAEPPPDDPPPQAASSEAAEAAARSARTRDREPIIANPPFLLVRNFCYLRSSGWA